MKRKKWLLVGAVLGFVILLAISLTKGRTVLGVFENGKDGLLYRGSKEEIQAETKRLIEETGKDGLILGADCTIPSDIAVERIQWVREAVAK